LLFVAAAFISVLIFAISHLSGNRLFVDAILSGGIFAMLFLLGFLEAKYGERASQ